MFTKHLWLLPLSTTLVDSLQPHYQKKRFSTFNSDLESFCGLASEARLSGCLYGIHGKYWVPVFNILEKRGIRVVIANPKWVKAVKGTRTIEGFQVDWRSVAVLAL